MKKLNLFVIALATGCATGAFAQAGAGYVPAPSTISNSTQNYAQSVFLTILARADVQSDIDLTSQESTSLGTLQTTVQDSHTVVTNLQQLRTFESAVFGQVAAVLSDAQAKRLQELTIQYLGYEALYSTRIQEQVGLNANQTLQVDVILNELLAAVAKSNAQTAAQLNAQAKQALAAVLTNDQAVKLQTLAAVPLGTA